MKKYPLLIENIGEDDYAVMSRGHQNLVDFCAAVRESYDWPLGWPEHKWFRAIPSSEGTMYVPAVKNSRGAFPVTVSFESYSGKTIP